MLLMVIGLFNVFFLLSPWPGWCTQHILIHKHSLDISACVLINVQVELEQSSLLSESW